MAPRAFIRVNYVPMTLVIVAATGLVTTYIVAVLHGDVTPYVPLISEAGDKFPEAGIFSIFLYLTATLGASTVYIRYLIVDELNRGIRRGIKILNLFSFIVGIISLTGMLIIAAYPSSSVPTAHSIGALVLFIGGILYAALQTWLSYMMSPCYNGKTICHIRLAMTVCSLLSLIALLVLGPVSLKSWFAGKPKHWTGSKVPGDQGFDLVTAFATAEWVMAIFIFFFYFTFIREFGKVCVHLRVQLLVKHFDEDPQDESITSATEYHSTINQENLEVLSNRNYRPEMHV